MKLIPIKAKGCENLYRHPKTDIIYFKMFRAGRGEICKSTRVKSTNEAKVIADNFRLQFFGKSTIKRGRKFCGELFPQWIERKKVSTRPATIASLEASWAHLKPYLETMLPDDVTAQWWESVYVPEKRTGDNIRRKFFNDRKWLSMFLLSLKRDGVLTKTPHLIDVDPPRAAGKVYADREIEQLIHHAGRELYLQILMAVTMGMRIGEIMSLEWSQVNMKARTIYLPPEKTKIKKERTFGISDSVFELLTERDEFGPVFKAPQAQDQAQGRQGNKKAWATCKRKAGVSGRFHDLRHTFLTKAFKCSTNPALICHYAGLSLDEAQKTYLHFTVEDTRQVSHLVRF